MNELLVNLAQIRELAFIIDGSEVGHEYIALMINLIYGKRALPIMWLVVKEGYGPVTVIARWGLGLHRPHLLGHQFRTGR